MKMRDCRQESHRARVKLITVNNNNNKRVERNNLRDASQGGDPDWKSMRKRSQNKAQRSK